MTTGNSGPPLVIVGASVRGVASSAVRAGFRIFAADLFGDYDLRAIAAAVTTIQPYPDGIPTAVARFPSGPLIYTGGLENHPSLLARLAADRPLAGSPPDAVARVRDPFRLAETVRNARLFFPDTRRDPKELPVDGTWLVKPVASAGGRGIRPWVGQAVCSPPHLWQKRISGRRLSVGYLLDGNGCRLIAASRQLIGCRWCRASPFAYCGSVDFDPTMLDASLASQVETLGTLLASHFGLAGLVGADLVVDALERLWVIEINPRPTASMELAERATGCSLTAMHAAAFGIESPVETERHPRTGTWAKAILFARRDVTFSPASLDTVLAQSVPWTRDDGWPAVADIPEPPCTIPSGAPVCTIFAHDSSPRTAIIRLRHREATLERAILG
jgi:predicted ATP-grasp superfamily ATP-dependent carboligase